MAIDLAQFHEVFFEESLEGLEIMEQSLLSINVNDETDLEIINNIFRAAHSIKGGSGTFGFDAITDFTHILETLLDEAREGKRKLTESAVELLLQASDCLREMIETLRAGGTIDAAESAPLKASFEKMLADEGPASVEVVAESIPEVESGVSSGEGMQLWRITFVPSVGMLLTGNEPVRLFRELEALGTLAVKVNYDSVPELHNLVPDECYLSWVLSLETTQGEEDILEVFDWVLDDCELTILQEASKEEPALAVEVASEAEEPHSEIPANAPAVIEPSQAPAPSVTKAAIEKPKEASATTSIRVGVDKVDSLINLVGELVITQSMLSELGSDFSMEKVERLSSGLEQLLQNTKELQESVMRIRMLPINFAFSRFPRMIRDLSAKMNKKVNLILSGEQTELDKTVMEKIGDPLVHLVRNAIDHGIETAEERLAAGKPEEGTIKLDAFHKGGNIVIEISDDGAGIDSSRILAKAREKGIVGEKEELPENKIFELIFEAGFSTADQVSDISGRGVGMDVVRRNIKSLGGRIEINSTLGEGSVFRVHLPLTLAILDGQLIRVDDEVYIIPIVSIVESLQIKKELVNQVSGNVVLYRLREDNVPIIPVYQEIEEKTKESGLDNSLLVVVESDGQKVGLLVDELLAQQQVVIKSLESNYRKVEGISGATILGDGSVSLILDVPGLITCSARQSGSRHCAA